MNSENLLRLASLYGLLTRFWSHEIDLELLTSLNDPSMRSAIDTLGGSVPPATEETVEALAVDFCQLMIGPKDHAPPVQSVWQEQKFQGKSVASMNNYIEAVPGFEPQVAIVDHIAVQFQFMSELLLAASSQEHTESHLAIASGFLNDHLSWTSPFLDRIQARAQTDFYRDLASMTQEFLGAELDEIK